MSTTRPSPRRRLSVGTVTRPGRSTRGRNGNSRLVFFAIVASALVFVGVVKLAQRLTVPPSASQLAPAPTLPDGPAGLLPTQAPASVTGHSLSLPTPVSIASRLEVPLVVRSSATYTTSTGALYVVGEAVNLGDVPAGDIRLAISLLDARGNVLAAGSANLAALSVVPPGGRWPFRHIFNPPPRAWTELRIQVQGEPYTPQAPSSLCRDLAIEGVTTLAPQTAWGAYAVSGRVVNTGRQTAEFVKVIAVAYDAASQVLDVADGYTALKRIAPGADAPFQLNLYGLRAAPARVEVVVEGRVAGD